MRLTLRAGDVVVRRMALRTPVSPEDTLKLTSKDEAEINKFIEQIDAALNDRPSHETSVALYGVIRVAIAEHLKKMYEDRGWEVSYKAYPSSSSSNDPKDRSRTRFEFAPKQRASPPDR